MSRPEEETGEAGVFLTPPRAGLSWRGAHLAIQAGERHARFVLAERRGGDWVLRGAKSIDLRLEGLITPEETARHLKEVLEEFPGTAVALVLPLGRAISQVVEAKSTEPAALRALAQGAGGRQFDEVPSVFDARKLEPFGGYGNPAWVTIAREADVELQLMRSGVAAERVSHVTSTENALWAAWRRTPERPETVVLVEVGSAATAVVVVVKGQAVFAASFDEGTGGFARALAGDLGCQEEEAEIILGREGVEVLQEAAPGLREAMRRWGAGLEGLLGEWRREAGADGVVGEPPRWFSGGLARTEAGRKLLEICGGGVAGEGWPKLRVGDGELSMAEFAVACGAAAIGLGLEPTPVNLLPAEVKQLRLWGRRLGWVNAAALAVLVAGAVWLGAGLWARSGELKEAEARLSRLEETRGGGTRLGEAKAAREAAYLEALPALYRQKRTHDLLAGLRLLRAQESGERYWFVLVADLESYRPNGESVGVAGSGRVVEGLRARLARPTGLVVELTVHPDEADKLELISQLAGRMRESGLFRTVDILPVRARQPMADAAVLAGDTVFALTLDAEPFVHLLPPVEPETQTRRRDRSFLSP